MADIIDRSVTDDAVVWATGPARHEGGSPNVVGAVAIAAACASIARHREAIEEHESRLLTRLRDGLEATYRELARSEDDAARSHAWVDRANAVRRWTTR